MCHGLSRVWLSFGLLVGWSRGGWFPGWLSWPGCVGGVQEWGSGWYSRAGWLRWWRVGGHEKLPIGGHETARWWPWFLPAGGHEIAHLILGG